MAKFALLADATARKFADPRKLSIPSSIAAAFVKWGLADQWTMAAKRRLFIDGCRDAATRLREAHKLVFDDDFSRLVVALAEQSPETIERVLSTARLPFDHCWIEWNRTSEARPDKDDFANHWGALLAPVHNGIEVVLITAKNNAVAPHILPGGLVFDVHRAVDDIIQLEHDGTEHYSSLDEEEIVGIEYFKRWKNLQPEAMRRIADHARFIIGLPPYGQLLIDTLRREVKAAKAGFGPVEELLGIISLASAGVFRELLCGLALVATHIGGAPLVESKPGKTLTRFYGGKFHPGIEYKVVQLVRPMTVPRLIRRAFPKTAPQPTRWHQVIGAWHHRRAPASNCKVHPRACEIARWDPLVGEDGELAGIDLQACAVCRRHRWFVRDHARGDLAIGMLDKSYEVIASKEQ